MEPANLDAPQPSDDALEAGLRRPLSPDLPEAGFSARVLAALPPPRRTRLSWRRILLCAGGAAAGAAAALATGHPLQLAWPTFDQLAAAVQAGVLALAQPANALTLLIVAAGLLYAWRGSDGRLSR